MLSMFYLFFLSFYSNSFPLILFIFFSFHFIYILFLSFYLYSFPFILFKLFSFHFIYNLFLPFYLLLFSFYLIYNLFLSCFCISSIFFIHFHLSGSTPCILQLITWSLPNLFSMIPSISVKTIKFYTKAFHCYRFGFFDSQCLLYVLLLQYALHKLFFLNICIYNGISHFLILI